jgi:thiamine biosynthesis protein ThiS
MITARGKPMEWHEGLTIIEVLQKLGYAVPAALVQLNGRHVPRHEWAATAVSDGAVLDVQVIMAGG